MSLMVTFTIHMKFMYKKQTNKKKSQVRIINLDYNFKMDTIGISCFIFIPLLGLGNKFYFIVRI